MTLIKKEPIGSINIELTKRGNIKKIAFIFPELEKPEPCIECKKPTTKTRMGFAECEDCQKYENCCNDCENMICKSTFCCPTGEDMDDYVQQWTACGIRKIKMEGSSYQYEILSQINFESSISASDIPVSEKRKCFKPRDVAKSRYCQMRTGNIPLIRCQKCGYNKKYDTNEVDCNYE
jgi:hypothetical protein